MGTIPNLFGLLCLVALLGHWRPDCHFLTNGLRVSTNHQITNDGISKQLNHQKPSQLLKIAQSQIGIREARGNNDGQAVEKYLAYTGNQKGDPWCASFVSWVFGQAHLKQPRTAWSPALFPKARLIAVAKPAAVFGIYFPDKARIAHAGIVEEQKGNWLYTIEGNTNLAGSREGDGVYRKLRHVRTIRFYADWLAIEKGGHHEQ